MMKPAEIFAAVRRINEKLAAIVNALGERRPAHPLPPVPRDENAAGIGWAGDRAQSPPPDGGRTKTGRDRDE